MDITARQHDSDLEPLSSHERLRYCSQCGEELMLKGIGDEGLVPFCSSCNKPYFKFSYPCILATVIHGNEIALLRQRYISTTHWVLVAGLIKQGETAEETVIREVAEETGLSVVSCRYISSYYHPERDLLMLGFITWVTEREFGHSSEVDDICWFLIDEAEHMLRDGSIGQRLFREVKAYLE